MKVAVLYICTGKYSQFFADFYESARQHFLRGIAEVQYFVFSDDFSLQYGNDVHFTYKPCLGFPLDSAFRFQTFLQVEEQLQDFDYLFFLNSNVLFIRDAGMEILPTGNDNFIGAKWPRQKPFDHPAFYPYERNKKSLAYVQPREKKPYIYFMGGIYGAPSRLFLQMTKTIASNIQTDYDNGILAISGDESHTNKYFRTHSCQLLPTGYCMPEEWITPEIHPTIIFRDKVKLDPYFDKERNHSIWNKAKKTVHILYQAVNWYI